MHQSTLLSLFTTVSGLTTLAVARPSFPLEKRDCIGNIGRFEDVANAIKCTTVNINAFTVPVTQTLILNLQPGTVVNQQGTVKFAGGQDWLGNMVQISGTGITWNNPKKFVFDGNGAYWWDGKGSNGGRDKPHPMIKITATGIINDMSILNPPVQAFSISNPAALHMVSPIVNVGAGSGSNTPHNTDGFDCSASKHLTISSAQVTNQDDCIAINDATDLTLENSTCDGGHGISIGSIKEGKVVARVTIRNNKVINSDNGLRIKSYSNAVGASVSDVTYSGNTVVGAANYGVIIQENYTNDGATGTPSNNVPITNVNFVGDLNTVSVGSKGQQVYVLCGSTSCSSTVWDWSALKTSGGSAGSISAGVKITGWKAS